MRAGGLRAISARDLLEERRPRSPEQPMCFRRRLALAPPNVPPDWEAGDAWRRREAPKDLTRGELDHMDALRALAGRPLPGGCLLPVTARLARDPLHRDATAIRVEVGERQVGHLAAIIARRLAPGWTATASPASRSAR
jgi:hypothetical protein